MALVAEQYQKRLIAFTPKLADSGIYIRHSGRSKAIYIPATVRYLVVCKREEGKAAVIDLAQREIDRFRLVGKRQKSGRLPWQVAGS